MIFGKHINKYYGRYWYLFLGILLTDILLDVTQFLFPQLTGYTIKCVQYDAKSFLESSIPVLHYPDGTQEAIPFYARSFQAVMITMVVAAVVIVGGRIIWRLFSARLAGKIERDMRKEMYAHIQTMSLSYFSNKKIGGLLSYFTQDLQAIKQLFGEGFIFLTDFLVLGSIALVLMFRLSVNLALICAIPLIVFFLFGGLVGKGQTKRSKNADDAFEHLSDFTEENLQGYSVVKSFRKEKERENQFAELARIAKVKNISLMNFSSLLDGGINIIISILYAFFLIFGGYSLIHTNPAFLGNIKDVGDFTMFASYQDMLIWPMIAGGILISEMSNAKAAYQRISTILDSREDNPDLPSASAHSPLQGGVEVRNLSFTYPGTEKEILKDISFRAKPGEIIGIMGRTGSGKSTLVTLLSKLYPIPEGKIFFNGIDINGYTKSSLREQIGFVAQTSYLFSGTITETIGFSELPGKKIDEEKVKRAASFADVDKDIEEFPLQYSTVLGEKGSTVSGGQRQRLSIARAIYKDPKILILDDSLSAVDADTEKKILSNIRNSHKGVTTFLIAERISALEDADKILVLDQGRLVGSGDSKTLLKTCPLFHDIAEMQKLEKEVR